MMSRDPRVAPFVTGSLRVPVLLQQEVVECGAACLSMVLAYYGKWVSLAQSRAVCNVGRDGVSAAAILKAARSFGLEARGMRSEPENLGDLRFPLIVYMEFRHFMVLVRGTKRGVVVNDPGFGQRTMSWEEFDLAFTGIALELTPGEGFTQTGQRPSVLKELARIIAPERRNLALALVAGGVGALALMAIPQLLRVFVNGLYGSLTSRRLPTDVLSALAILSAVVVALVLWARDRALVLSAVYRSCDEARSLFGRIMLLPMSFFRLRHRGVLASQIQSFESLIVSVVVNLGTLFGELLILFGALATSVLVNPQIGAVIVALVLLWGVVVAGVGRWAEPVMNRRVIAVSNQAGGAAAAFYDLERIRANGDEGNIYGRWTGAMAAMSSDTSRAQMVSLLYFAMPIAFVGAGSLMVTWVAALGILAGQIPVGEMFQMQLLLLLAVLAAQGCVTSIAGFAGMSPSLALARDVGPHARLEDVDQDVTMISGDRTAEPLSGAVKVSGLGLLVDHQTWLLKDVTFSVAPGEHVAVVGRSGAGKSTLAHLLAGLEEPTQGAVTFDGLARHELARATLTRSVAYVEQLGSMLRGTVRDNLALWDPTIPDAVLLAAAKDAGILADILAKPGGLDRQVDVERPEWSGGQRQRLAIARALVKDPSLLILDEATSGLDPIVEREIYDTIRARGCSVVIIAHRLSTVRYADLIVVLDGGVVVEQGTHDELIDRHGCYWELVNDEA